MTIAEVSTNVGKTLDACLPIQQLIDAPMCTSLPISVVLRAHGMGQAS